MDETVVDFLSSDAFVTVFSVVVAAASLFWALRTDTGKRIDKLEGRLVHRIDKSEERLVQRIDKGDEALGRRIDKQEERLGRRIDKGDEALGHRIDRQEERARANHAELLGKIAEFAREIGELKATVSAVNAKLDERSSPRPLVVRETGKDYPVGGESRRQKAIRPTPRPALAEVIPRRTYESKSKAATDESVLPHVARRLTADRV